MFAVLQVSVRRALRTGLRFPALRVPALRVPAAGCAGSVSGSEAAGSGVRAVHGPDHGQVRRSCTVDPNLEEEFVFVDFTGEGRNVTPRAPLIPV